MKTKATIGTMELEVRINGETQIIKTPAIDMEYEFSLGELKELYVLQKQLLKELPALAQEFAQGFLNACYETAQTFDKLEDAYTEEKRTIAQEKIKEFDPEDPNSEIVHIRKETLDDLLKKINRIRR